jgi:hypothetical protein
VNICQNGFGALVGMEIKKTDKHLKTLERVKGIEPSYSAWKAAALPLSYTRIASRSPIMPGRLSQPPWRVSLTLNRPALATYTEGPANNERR